MSDFGSRSESPAGSSSSPVVNVENGGQTVPVTPEAAPIDNPLGSRFHFKLYVPEVEVRMVNASVLSDYEVWIFSSSLSFSGVVGFLVAYFQSLKNTESGGKFHSVSTPSFLYFAILLAILFGLFLFRALKMRRDLHGNSRTYKMRATEVLENGNESD